ncbi:MAG: hypothetical protein ACJ74W_22525 [Pyrinomonadaceae bacterium]
MKIARRGAGLIDALPRARAALAEARTLYEEVLRDITDPTSPVDALPPSVIDRLGDATRELKESRRRSQVTLKEIGRLKRETRKVLDRIEARLPEA